MSQTRRKLMVLVLILGAGTMFQAVSSGCLQYYTYAALEGINFCSVLNCDSSTFFNLCSPVPLLADCPTTAGGGG